MAANEVLSFLQKHNRPFSFNDISQGVTGEFGKSAIQKALDSLIAKGLVLEKVYGKAKVYCVTQKSDVPANKLKEEIMTIDRKINETSMELKDVTDKLKNCEAQFGGIKRKMSLAEATQRKEELEEELEDINKELEKYSDMDFVCPKEKARVEGAYNKIVTEYKKRKRMCMEILNTILENYPKSKKHLFEDVGIETDEDVNFSL